MIQQVHVRYVALVLLFTFCQVIGAMCAVPDLSERHDTAALIEDRVACPMDEAIMCPPSLTSSPKRQINYNLMAEVDPALIPTGFPVLTDRSVQAISSLDSAYSIVPISIESSSVLRI